MIYLKRKTGCILRRMTSVFLMAVLFTAMAWGTVSLEAAESAQGWSLDGNGVLTIETDAGMQSKGWNKESVKRVVIKDGVKEIGTEAFRGCNGLMAVTIPSSVTSIGNNAFAQCYMLKTVTIPSSVTSIGNSFWACQNLTEIKVEADNPNYKDIDGVLFNKAGTKLIQCPAGIKGAYVILEGVESIGDHAFGECGGLTSVTITEGVTSIGDDAFAQCYMLKTVTIPSSVTNIGKGPFETCTRLTEIKVAADNQNYKDTDGVLFDKAGTKLIQCPAGIEGAYTIPHGVTSIDEEAFENCGKLTSIEIPESVESIGMTAFYGCGNLTSIEIPEGVKNVGNSAFYKCGNLTSVTLPSSIQEIGRRAFGYNTTTKIDNFTVCGHKGTAAESYANENGFAFVEIGSKSDSSTGIAIQYPKDAVENDESINLITKSIPENGDEYEAVRSKFNAENAGNAKFAAFDIKLQDGKGNTIQPKGEITVKIPVPAGFNGSKCKVYYMDGNGKFTDMNAAYNAGFIVFNTNHFSMYIVTEAQINSAGSGDNTGSGDTSDNDNDTDVSDSDNNDSGDASDSADNDSSAVSGGSVENGSSDISGSGDSGTPAAGNNAASAGSVTDTAVAPDNGGNAVSSEEEDSGSEAAVETSDESVSPQTGDTSGRSTALLMVCIVSAGAAALAVRRKKA